jgi:hypothetical protein
MSKQITGRTENAIGEKRKRDKKDTSYKQKHFGTVPEIICCTSRSKPETFLVIMDDCSRAISEVQSR